MRVLFAAGAGVLGAIVGFLVCALPVHWIAGHFVGSSVLRLVDYWLIAAIVFAAVKTSREAYRSELARAG